MVTKPGKPDPDPCAPQRQRLDDLDASIADIRKDLADRDFPPQQRPALEAELARLQGRRPQLARLLVQCEARAGGTPKKAVAAKKKKTVVTKKKPPATKKKKAVTKKKTPAATKKKKTVKTKKKR